MPRLDGGETADERKARETQEREEAKAAAAEEKAAEARQAAAKAAAKIEKENAASEADGSLKEVAERRAANRDQGLPAHFGEAQKEA